MVDGGWPIGGRALIDFNIKTHAAFPALKEKAAQEKISIYLALNNCVQEIEAREGEMRLTRQLHVLPDFNGNRAPHANPESRGAVLGLSLSAELRDLAALYLATIQGLAYGTRILSRRSMQEAMRMTRYREQGRHEKSDFPAGTCQCHKLPHHPAERNGFRPSGAQLY